MLRALKVTAIIMNDMGEIFEHLEFLKAHDEIPKGLPLVVALQGFSDAGNAVAQLGSFLRDASETTLLYEFDSDDYIDYRSRRPTITFVTDHLEDYEPHRLQLLLQKDSLGAPYLLLLGFEPDFKWNRFVHTALEIIEKLEVSMTTWVHAIPMPVPHTRTIGTTVSGNRHDLIEKKSAWQPTTKLAASIVHVLEHSVYEKQLPIVGFVLLVPHYLASTDYPHTLMTSLECVMDATGLLFDTESVAESMDSFIAQVDAQIAENEESAQMVANLERRYDEYVQNLQDAGMNDRGSDFSMSSAAEENLPTGEQLASDFEKFLADELFGDDANGQPTDENSKEDPGQP